MPATEPEHEPVSVSVTATLSVPVTASVTGSGSVKSRGHSQYLLPRPFPPLRSWRSWREASSPTAIEPGTPLAKHAKGAKKSAVSFPSSLHPERSGAIPLDVIPSGAAGGREVEGSPGRDRDHRAPCPGWAGEMPRLARSARPVGMRELAPPGLSGSRAGAGGVRFPEPGGSSWALIPGRPRVGGALAPLQLFAVLACPGGGVETDAGFPRVPGKERAQGSAVALRRAGWRLPYLVRWAGGRRRWIHAGGRASHGCGGPHPARDGRWCRRGDLNPHGVATGGF